MGKLLVKQMSADTALADNDDHRYSTVDGIFLARLKFNKITHIQISTAFFMLANPWVSSTLSLAK